MAIADNTTALRNLLALANGLPSASSGPAYGKAVFFGDSLSMGTNNGDYSFVDILAEAGIFESVAKHAYPGTTIGPYREDSALNNYCLVSQVERYASDIQDADIIFLEYGGNDYNDVVRGAVVPGWPTDSENDTSMCGYATKALTTIHNLNPKARVVWLAFKRWASMDAEVDGEGFCEYALYLETSLHRVLKKYCVNIVDISSGIDYRALASDDGVHPTTEGHVAIAQNVVANMFRATSTPYLYKEVMFVVADDYSTTTKDTLQVVWSLLVNGGIDVYATVRFPGMYFAQKLQCSTYSADEICFTGQVYDAESTKVIVFTFKWTGAGVGFYMNSYANVE